MPKSVTPESLRAEADALDAEAARLQEEAADLRALADRMDARAIVLSSGPDSDTIGTMPEGQTYKFVKKGLHRGPALKSRGPAATVAKKLGLSLRGLAQVIGFPYETLKKQDARGSVTAEVRARLDAVASKAKRA